MLGYRAIWKLNDPDAERRIMTAFGDWVTYKSNGSMTGPLPGRAAGTYVTAGVPHEVRAELTVETVEQTVYRFRFVENRDDETRWTTTLRSWPGDRQPGSPWWVWVDVEAVGPGVDSLVIAAPRLVRDLHPDGSAQHLRVTGRTAGELLAEKILDPRRQRIVAVFADDAGAPKIDQEIETAADRAARTSVGTAIVCSADHDAHAAISEMVGYPYRVEPGDLRIYLPGVDPSNERDRFRHRFIPRRRFAGRAGLAGREIVAAASRASSVRRPPETWISASQALTEIGQTGDTDEFLALAIAENERLTQQIDQLQVDLADAAAESWLHSVERDELANQQDGAQRLIKRLRDELRRTAPEIADVVGASEDASALPIEASSCTQVAELVRDHLSDVIYLPEEACRDLEDLDAAPNATAWAQNAWRGFRALHAFALDIREGYENDFWTWCSTAGRSWSWPATPKKLAMRESETVMNSTKLSAKRLLPVDPSVHPSGHVLMQAHLKIAEGGGSLAPRIYFLTDRPTATVHIGFFGPHKHMPNTKT